MSKTISCAFLLAILLITNTTGIVGQQSAVDLDRKVKSQVKDLGAGAKVTVFMKDGTKIRGSISQILDDSFDVTINKATQSSIVSYRDVEKVKRRGWTSSAKMGVGIAIGAGAIVAVIAILVSSANIQ